MNPLRKPNTFSKSEFRSLVVTITIIILAVLLPPYASRLAPAPVPPDISFEFLEPPDTIRVTETRPVKNVVQSGEVVRKSYQASIPPIDINTADSLDWKTLPGIGNVLSKRIVKFRDKLGGFYCIEQVSRTYGLEKDVFERIKSRLVLSTPHRKYTCDSLSVRELAGHPYISWKQAEKLYQQCSKGDTMSVQTLYEAGDSAWVESVRPYLTVSDEL